VTLPPLIDNTLDGCLFLYPLSDTISGTYLRAVTHPNEYFYFVMSQSSAAIMRIVCCCYTIRCHLVTKVQTDLSTVEFVGVL